MRCVLPQSAGAVTVQRSMARRPISASEIVGPDKDTVNDGPNPDLSRNQVWSQDHSPRLRPSTITDLNQPPFFVRDALPRMIRVSSDKPSNISFVCTASSVLLLFVVDLI